MNDIFLHVVLFLIASLSVVGMGSIYSDAEDGPALRNFPRRYLTFVLGCGVLVGIMLLLEHTVASVS